MAPPSLSGRREQRSGSLRRIAATISMAMAALMIAAAPASAASQPVLLNSWIEFLGARAGANLTVWDDHQKNIWICDRSTSDGVGLGIEVDPSGPQDTIIYNALTTNCFEHRFWYSVRKFRFIVLNDDGSINDDSLPWIYETPFPDF